jgi:alpha-mannosidase
VALQNDVFGHPITMPQIAQKAGIELYLFGRPHDPDRPPMMWWQGPDGSRVLGDSAFGGIMDHAHVTVRGMEIANRIGVKNLLMLYGQGDHGGVPNPDDIAAVDKLQASPEDMRVKFSNVTDYLDVVLTEKKDFPTWQKELNPVFAGCYTSVVDIKRHNREAEQLLLNAEKMTELAVFLKYRDYFPNFDLREAWKLVLLNQTHDLAAGTGIAPIYADSAREYQKVFELGERAMKFSLEDLGLQVNSSGDGVPVVVYNPQSFDRTDLVTAEVSAFALPLRMVAVHGEETVPVAILKPPAKAGSRETATVAFVAQKVPQMGLKLYRLLPDPGNAKTDALPVRTGSKPRPYLENEFLRVELNPETGNIVRLYDKMNKREAFHGEGDSLTAWEDTSEEARKTSKEYAGPAWDIGLTGKKWDLDKALHVEITEQGPVRGTIRVVHRFRDSEFTQDISLIAGVPRVDVAMAMNWHESSTFLKANFPAGVASGKVSAEVPYGVIERDQNGQEAVMGKWVDISGSDYGVAIINNGRNGYDARDNAIHLSVIRGPWGPDPRTDEGEHEFGYSIFPHPGGWREGKVQFQALAFNSPLLALQEPKHPSPQWLWGNGRTAGLPDVYSFLKTGSDHVVLSALKQMEGFYDMDAIARFVEVEGREGDVTLEIPRKVRATETTLLEDVIVGPLGEGTTIKFHMKPWEIKTVRLKRL